MAVLALSLLMPSLSQAASASDRAYRSAKSRYHRLLRSPREMRYRDHWTAVIDGFLAVSRSFPRSPRAADALYMAGKASQGLYRVSRSKEDARRAVKLYDSLVQEHPDDSLADDALVLGGRIEEKVLADLPAAYQRYEEAVKRYPAGDMAERARHKAAELVRYAPAAAPSPASPAPSDGPAEVTGIHCRSAQGCTRVTIDVSQKADFVAKYLGPNHKEKIPPRIYVDVRDAAAASQLAETMDVDDGPLRQIRTGRPDSGTVRVVLDLSGSHDYKVYPLADPFRIIIDVADPSSSGGAAKGEIAPSIAPGAKDGIAKILQETPSEPSLKVPLSAAGGKKELRRIVVDAGHGGKDPGAIGPDGVEEKNVALKIARALASRLRKELGCEVILTRDDDTFLPLRERTAIANKVGADLFISIHANASPNAHAYGIETYYLNFSKNKEATAVVARENDTSLKQVGDLEHILFDLMANSKINESSRLAAEIQKSLVGGLRHHYSHIKNLGVRQGPFYVLLGATMPSVLVETAFISNRREESRLTNSRYDRAAVDAIADGVRNYAKALNLIATK